jgi:hypothetical protein
MKKRSLLVLPLILALSTPLIPAAQASLTCAEGGACILGDTGPGGGLVFFVKGTGTFNVSYSQPGESESGPGSEPTNYLVELTSDQQAALNFDYLEVAPTGRTGGAWGESGVTLNRTSRLIGTSRTNTQNILLTQTGPVSGNAARYANEYISNGKLDWYLPSYDELLLIMLRVKLGETNFDSGNFPDGLWASSDDLDITTATYSALGQLSGNINRSANTPGVRAVRAFSSDYVIPSAPAIDSAVAQAQRDEAVRKNRAAIIASLASGEKPLLDLYQSSDVYAVTKDNIQAINKELSGLPAEQRSDFFQITKVIHKFEVIEKLSNSTLNTSLYCRDLSDIGILPADQSQKTWILLQLRKLPSDQVDSYAEAKVAIDKYAAVVQARKDRFAAIKKKIEDRLAGFAA